MAKAIKLPDELEYDQAIKRSSDQAIKGQVT